MESYRDFARVYLKTGNVTGGAKKRCPGALTVFGYTQRKGGHGMDVQLKDILVMKKAHPCGEKRWQVLRVGADFKLRCLGCGHEVMGPRSKFEKNIRSVCSEAN